MSSDADPPRLLDRPPDDLLGEALRGAAADVPGPDRVEAMLLRFPGGPTGGGGGGGPTGPPHPFAKGLLKSAATKTAASVIAGVLLGGGVASIVIVASGPKNATTTSSARPATSPAPVASSAIAAATTSSEPSSSAAAPSSAPSTTAAPNEHPTTPAPSASAPLRSEIEMLREAQAAAGADPARALAICNETAQSYPNGQLGQEREIIRIQALTTLGRTGEARAAADAFKTQHPHSAYNERIDQIVGVKP